MFFADKVMVSTPFLFTVIVYALVFPSSAFISNSTSLVPIAKFLFPKPLIVSVSSCLVAFTVTVSVSYSTVTW